MKIMNADQWMKQEYSDRWDWVVFGVHGVMMYTKDADKYADYVNAELKAEVERLMEALRLILPLAKGYAAEHRVGANQQYIEQAEEASRE